MQKRLQAGFSISKATDVEKFFIKDSVKEAIELVLQGAEGSPSSIVFTYLNGQLGLYEPGTPHEAQAIYFQRTCGNRPVNAKDLEMELCYGEILNSPLEDFDRMLGQVYLPVLKAQTSWGASNSEQGPKDFFDAAVSLRKTLDEAIVNVSEGVRLEMLDPENKFISMDTKQKTFEAAAMNPDCVDGFEQLMIRWCAQVEQLLAQSDVPEAPSGRKDKDDGPRSELQYWRQRAQKFSTIIDQLQTRECKVVLGVLREAKHTNDAVNKTLKRWRVLDNEITDAANEAKDNVKYLSTLDKYMQVLYEGTTEEVIESLQPLLHNVKMMQQISRYYNTEARMTTLFEKITNQMIANCRMNVTKDGKPWDQNPEKLVISLKGCLKLYENYLEQYEATKNKVVLSTPKEEEEQFELDETVIFGRMELFNKRLEKLISMFSTVGQFNSIAKNGIEGMDEITNRFLQIVETCSKKPYDLLDTTKTTFDRDFTEFENSIHNLEVQLQGFVNVSFETIPNTEAALCLLTKFQAIIKRDMLQADLAQKHMVIFQNYGLDLDFVQRTYEKYKTSPPMPRTMPPVAGSITWCRQLLRRIEEPMLKFQSNPAIMTTKESLKIVKTYNRVGTALVEFETLWHEAWCKSVEAAKAGLQATLVIRHPQNPRMWANFDPEILQLVRESKCL
jgi:dynein heavy chain